jgi:GR25 family glycosyltransferase involved in LPS biosynthesis
MTTHPFHTAYCLNLDRNTSRWQEVQRQFEKVGISAERINCVESEVNRYISFNHSQFETVKKGYETGLPFAIFEDDVVFDNTLPEIEMPPNWDLVYLGANIMGDWKMPTRFDSNLSLLHNAWQTHAIVYSLKGAKFIIDNFDPDTLPVYDEWLRVNVMPMMNTYLLSPMIAYQRPGYSDLWQVQTNYIDVHIEGNKYLSRL